MAGQKSAAREEELRFRELRRTSDPELRERLISEHMNLVRFLAHKFANRSEPLEDLIQVGMIGLINAVDRFDPERGTRFATYATPTIVGEIKRYFRDRGWAIKVPRRLQEISLAANHAVESLQQRLNRAPTVAEIAVAVGASEEDTMEALELGQLYDLPSLDSEVGGEDEESRASLADYLGEDDRTFEAVGLKARLDEAISKLPEREQVIIRLRFFKGISQTEVAKRLRISQMHVSRLQHRALKQLRETMREGP